MSRNIAIVGKSALLAVVTFGAVALAGVVALPNTFTAGTAARAAEVNANFNAVKSAVDDNDTRINSIDGSVLSAIGSFSDDQGPLYTVSNNAVPIAFTSTSVSTNMTLNHDLVTLPTPGVYKLSYCIRTAGTANVGSRLVINGSPINASVIPAGIARDQWCRSTTLALTASDSTAQLQLFGGFASRTLLSPGGAELQIERLR